MGKKTTKDVPQPYWKLKPAQPSELLVSSVNELVKGSFNQGNKTQADLICESVEVCGGIVQFPWLLVE